MFETLEEIYTKFDYDIKKIKKYSYLTDYILDLYNNKNIEIDSSDVNKLLWNGNYYKNIEKDYDKMKKYYLMAIELNDSNAMNSLGYYYQNIEKDYDEMKKYYLMAIELNNDSAMNKLNNYNIINKTIYCPISLESKEKCYQIKKCNHEFSSVILMNNIVYCPLCRIKI